MSSHQLSRDAHDRLSAELKDLTTRGRIDIANQIEEARLLGDLSENGDYHAAKEEQGKMEGRIRQLEGMLLDAEVVDTASGGPDDVVAPGRIVAVRYEGDDEAETYLFGSIEERVDGYEMMTPGSPLGRACNGAHVGETVRYETPTGATLAVEVVEVSELT